MSRVNFSFDKADTFKKIVDAISLTAENINFTFDNENGISAMSMDTSQVSLVHLYVDKQDMRTFELGKPFVMGVNTINLKKVLQCFPGDHPLVMSVDETDEATLTISGGSEGKEMTVELELMEIEAEALGVPESEFNYAFEMKVGDLANIFKNKLSIGSDTCTIDASSSDGGVNGVLFNSSSDIVGKHNVLIKFAPGKFEAKKPVKGLFAISYLSKFMKSGGIDSVVKVFMIQDNPIQFMFPITGNSGKSFIRFFLAPKIDEE